MKKRILFLVVIIFAFMSSFGCWLLCSDNTKSDSDNVYLMAQDLYFPVLSNELKKEKNNEALSAKENAYQMEIFKQKRKLVVNSIQVPEVGDAEKINLMFSILSKSSNASKSSNGILNKNVFKDLEMLCGHDSDFKRNIFSKIDDTKTVAGLVQFQKMLCSPTTDVKVLVNRQNVIRALVNNTKLRENLEKRLKVIHDVENDLIWMWKEIQDEVLKYFDEAYFGTFLNRLNKNEFALEAKSIGIFSNPFFVLFFLNIFYYVLASFINEREVDPLNFDVHALLLIHSAFILSMNYISGATIFAPSINHFKICDKLQKKMKNISTYFRAVNAIGKIVASDNELSLLFPNTKNLFSSEVVGDEAKILIESLQADTFKCEPSFFSNYGRVLASFKILQDVKNNIINSLAVAGDIDAYVSLANLYRENELSANAKFCFVNFENLDTPHLKLEGFWHPIINKKAVVINDLELGEAGKGSNVILTGPNAGGKSTSLKATILAVWFAQTVGIAPAHAMTLTPFSKINSYLNIADIQCKESLFQAEMNRAKSLIDEIKALGKSEFCLVIMDEIFTGTNPKEGEAAAYGVAKYLSNFSNSMAIVATHFTALTDLEVATDGLFKNYKVSVENSENGFVYPYKLEAGISDQPIALQILEHEGFDKEIIDEAQAIMAC